MTHKYTWLHRNRKGEEFLQDIEAETMEDSSRISYAQLKREGNDEFNHWGRCIAVDGKRLNERQKFEVEVSTIKPLTEEDVKCAVEGIPDVTEANVTERRGGGYNAAKPTSKQITYWKRLTDENNHGLVRRHICTWAFKNAKTDAVKDTVFVSDKVIQGFYDKWARTGRAETKEKEEACMRMSIVIGAIRAEFGPDTADKISSCL